MNEGGRAGHIEALTEHCRRIGRLALRAAQLAARAADAARYARAAHFGGRHSALLGAYGRAHCALAAELCTVNEPTAEPTARRRPAVAAQVE
jgi:hypothetical protein